MRFISLKTKGLIPFPEEQEIQFPEKALVAVTGENGAGKTTLLDCIPLALYGVAPNRPGSLYTPFQGRDAYLDLTFEMSGREYQIRRLIDAEGRKQKPYLFIDGQPITEGKVAEFEASLLRHLNLSETAFMASVYHAQNGRGNPLSLSDRERSGLLSEVLGLAKFQQPYELVVEGCQRTDREIATLEAKASFLRGSCEDVQTIEEEAQHWRRLAESAKAKTDQVQSDLNCLRQELANAQANAQNLEPLRQQIADAETAIRNDNAIIAEKTERIQNNEKLRADADKIQLALDAAATAKQQATKLESAITELQEKRTAEDAAQREKIRTATDELDRIKNVQTSHLRAIHETENRIRDLQNQKTRATEMITRLQPQVNVIDRVPCVGTDLQPKCELLANARDFKAQIEQAERDIEGLEPELAKALETKSIHETNKQGLDTQERAAEEALHLAQISGKGDELLARIVDRQNGLQIFKTQLADLEPLVKQAPYLEGIQERIDDYRQAVTEAAARVLENASRKTEAQKKLDQAADITNTISALTRQVQEAEVSIEAIRVGGEAALANAAKADQKLQGIKEQKNQLEEILADLERTRNRFSFLQILREGLGPTGAKALKIDAAGPEISELVNALLRECYGSRFTITIKTQRELTTKDELRECLQFSIIDNETGEETAVENKSGGEQALIKEVISLGLSIFQRRHSGVDTRTLVRDECSAPLSESNTELYIRMLRKAVEIGGFEQVFYVSHKGAAQQMADAVLHIENGQVKVKEG